MCAAECAAAAYWQVSALAGMMSILHTQVAFDAQMHELKLLMAADEKLWQLRGSVVSIAADTAAAPQGGISCPVGVQEPDWTAQQVLSHVQRPPHHMQWLCASAPT